MMNNLIRKLLKEELSKLSTTTENFSVTNDGNVYLIKDGKKYKYSVHVKSTLKGIDDDLYLTQISKLPSGDYQIAGYGKNDKNKEIMTNKIGSDRVDEILMKAGTTPIVSKRMVSTLTFKGV